MIDSKVILHDIYYDTYVNFLGTYPMFYTTGMCDVTYIGVYNTYLHGKCFLSAPYSDINSHASPHSKLLFVSSDSSPRVYAISQRSPLSKPSHALQKYSMVRV